MIFRVYTRPGCGLCEDLLTELAAFAPAAGIPVEVLDVDLEAGPRARFGHKVPVLLLDGVMVCHGRFDPQEVRKAIACGRRPV